MANSKSFNQSESLRDENIPQNQDFNFNQTEKVPITRACQKLIVYRNASQWGSVTHQMAVPVPSISCCVS